MPYRDTGPASRPLLTALDGGVVWRIGPGLAKPACRSGGRGDDECVVQRLESGARRAFPQGISGAGATPGMRGEGVQARSPLCRTEPSARGTPHLCQRF